MARESSRVRIFQLETRTRIFPSFLPRVEFELDLDSTRRTRPELCIGTVRYVVTVEHWSVGVFLERWSGGAFLERWSGGAFLEHWSIGAFLERWSVGAFLECLSILERNERAKLTTPKEPTFSR
jgi:hypothetical protein